MKSASPPGSGWCGKNAQGITGPFKTRDGGRRCRYEECEKTARGTTEFCSKHGGGKRCQREGCEKGTRGGTGLCSKHGGGKRCQRERCGKGALGATGLCKAHGGGKRCHYEGCEKSAQGATGLCKAHGGGKRCQRKGCEKNSQGTTDFCIEHGGGKRCQHEGCKKSARGATYFCKSHGGGRRCQHEGCKKSAVGATDFCIEHGGGKRCQHDGCRKSTVGATDFCIEHGGGRRCESEVCRGYAYMHERGVGYYMAPGDTSEVQVGTRLCYTCLGSLFPGSVTLKVRQEHLILAEIQRQLPELEQWFVEWDCPVSGGCSLRRPDMLWELPCFYFQIEVDEGGNSHEDDRNRLREIQTAMGTHRPGMVLRINADGLLRKRQHSDGEFKYSATKKFDERMHHVVDYIRGNVLKPGNAMAVPSQCGGDPTALHVEKLLF